MKEIHENKRYIYDPLYGIIYLPDFIWDVISCPELQRLREVRLCNINSLCLTGGANINRYEHAIGTCYLAQECLDSKPPLNPVSEKERTLFLLAALLHDVVSGAFGHSVQYIEKFEHEKEFKYAVLGEKGETYQYKLATSEPIFFGMPRELPSKLTKEDIEEIGEIIAGKGRFGPLIKGTMDLDNIDNVFRLAYHIGLVKSGETPLKLAKSLYIGYSGEEKGKLIVRKDEVSLIEEWYKIRKKLYLLLLQNPEEFSAKCMLTEAIEISKEKNYLSFNWYDVDFELLQKSSKVSSETSNIISRLMKGQLYGCMGIFSTSKIDKYELFTDKNERRELENELSERIKTKHLTTVDTSLRDIIYRKEIPDVLRENLSTIGYNLSDKAIIKSSGENKWKIEDKRYTYLVKQINNGIEVYELISKYKDIKVAIHPIRDVNKTERHVRIRTDEGKIIKIGKSTHQLLIGVFFKNIDLNVYKIDKVYKDAKIHKEVFTYLSNILEDPNLREVALYGEVKKSD